MHFDDTERSIIGCFGQVNSTQSRACSAAGVGSGTCGACRGDITERPEASSNFGRCCQREASGGDGCDAVAVRFAQLPALGDLKFKAATVDSQGRENGPHVDCGAQLAANSSLATASTIPFEDFSTHYWALNMLVGQRRVPKPQRNRASGIKIVWNTTMEYTRVKLQNLEGIEAHSDRNVIVYDALQIDHLCNKGNEVIGLL
jgi:hypothetical protein